MVVKCVGKKRGAFTNSKGEYCEFAKIMCVYSSEQVNDGVNQFVGDAVEAFSISFESYASLPSVPCKLDLDFNQRGKVIGINILKEDSK